jgi:hypothetical protein
MEVVHGTETRDAAHAGRIGVAGGDARAGELQRIVGWAVASPTETASPLATSTATATVTDTLGPTATPSVTVTYDGPIPPDPRTVCKPQGGPPLTAMASNVVTFGGGEEGQLLPSSLQQKPQVLTDSLEQGRISFTDATTVAQSFSALPAGQIGYVYGVTVRIVAFSPIATPVPNATMPCHDDFYTQPGGFQGTGDCGGVQGPVGSGEVTFAAATVGATATSSVIDRYEGVPLQPGQEPPPAQTQANMWIVIHAPRGARTPSALRSGRTAPGRPSQHPTLRRPSHWARSSTSGAARNV